MAKKGVKQLSLPSSFPAGRQRIGRDVSSPLGEGFGIYGRRVAGAPPRNAIRIRRRGRG